MQSLDLKTQLTALVSIGALSISITAGSAQFANGLVSYDPGNGYSPGFTNATTALGAPTMTLSYGPVDPFNPPFSKEDVVSVGAGGWLTLEFAHPIDNQPTAAFWGLDFVVFGNEGFVDTNWPGGITDGQLLNQAFGSPGVSRVFVSQNGVDYHELQIPTGISAAVDLLFPADSAGLIGQPVNPYLSNQDFAGLNLDGIRALYQGSAGGTGFDLDWAVDSEGQPVTLDSASFLRIEVSEGKLEVDAVAVVPEPANLGLLALAATVLLLRGRRVDRD